ncbi:hypothetical protein AGMMS50267_11450 [Spirochaetia bacterium]|nr:hypothetical protein AGMMS50267_11450 [Spirochaetia bacterium]
MAGLSLPIAGGCTTMGFSPGSGMLDINAVEHPANTNAMSIATETAARVKFRFNIVILYTPLVYTSIG